MAKIRKVKRKLTSAERRAAIMNGLAAKWARETEAPPRSTQTSPRSKTMAGAVLAGAIELGRNLDREARVRCVAAAYKVWHATEYNEAEADALDAALIGLALATIARSRGDNILDFPSGAVAAAE